MTLIDLPKPKLEPVTLTDLLKLKLGLVIQIGLQKLRLEPRNQIGLQKQTLALTSLIDSMMLIANQSILAIPTDSLNQNEKRT